MLLGWFLLTKMRILHKNRFKYQKFNLSKRSQKYHFAAGTEWVEPKQKSQPKPTVGFFGGFFFPDFFSADFHHPPHPAWRDWRVKRTTPRGRGSRRRPPSTWRLAPSSSTAPRRRRRRRPRGPRRGGRAARPRPFRTGRRPDPEVGFYRLFQLAFWPAPRMKTRFYADFSP